MGTPVSRAVLNSLHCERVTGNFLASKAWQQLSGILMTLNFTGFVYGITMRKSRNIISILSSK